MSTIRLLVANAITTSTGLSVTGATGEVKNRAISLSDGKCVNDVYFSSSYANELKNFDKLVPVTLKQDGSIDQRVGGVTVTLTQQEITGANLPLTIYQKVAEYLNTTYGWTVTVETV